MHSFLTNSLKNCLMLYTYNLVASFWKEGSASGSGNDNISDVECPGRIIAVDRLKAAGTKKINIIQQHLNVLVFKPSTGTVPRLLIQLLPCSIAYCFSWILR